MTFNTLHKLVKWTAIILWLIAAIIIAVAVKNHTFWSLTPIIAHNRIQNYLGWIIVIAFILSVCSPIINLASGEDNK